MSDTNAVREPVFGVVTDRRVKLALTFVVAFCSIAYELVYSELLTVFYGGTVVRYSVTIGLYMFSLGVGAVLSSQLGDAESNFLRTEVYLAVAGPLGAGFVIALNSFPGVVFPAKATVTLALSHLPILVVGLLSGFEIPLLESLVDERDGSGLALVGGLPRRAVVGTLSTLFTTEPADNDPLSEVLGVDYLGSLAGTVVYALVLYPDHGLVVSVLALGLLNALAAVTFAGWTLSRFTIPRARPTGGRWRAVLLVGLLVSGSYAGLVANGETVDRVVTGSYVEDDIRADYAPGQVEVDLRSYQTTAYQRVTVYDRTVADRAGTERCLRLDHAIQLCDSWVESYHAGLVDVPLSAYGTENYADLDVLLIGGGDYIAVDNLREYGVAVDQVDIDGEFLQMGREREYLRQFNDGAYRYDRLNTTVGDAFRFLRGSDREYDLILLDVPGARSDDSLSLYSREFYGLLSDHLTDRGVVVSWVYSKYSYPVHHRAYVNTVRAAGFDRFAPYYVYEDPDADGDRERAEKFYVLSDGPTPTFELSRARSPYVDRHSDRIGPVRWRPLVRYRGVDPNSVFDPNYDIVIGS
ncbi:spermidine synthase [Halobaculum sp. MBLA0143]|uniref:spermidine synthase n=1 Tax=Halobaculum sp. MBLA0143 TaxID=3079933 RepID=UPI0035260862